MAEPTQAVHSTRFDEEEAAMATLKAGSRMKSGVCDTQVMVIAAPAGDVDLTCGGAGMLEAAASGGGGSVDPDHKNGTQIGKRYVNEDATLELLCTKPGEGSLAVGGVALKLKEAKALPSSD
jgi:hypothetical protein